MLARKEQERREREEQEEADRQKAELERALEMSKALAKQSQHDRLKNVVRDEPAAGSDVANVKFQLPSGKKIARNFLKGDTVEVFKLIFQTVL